MVLFKYDHYNNIYKNLIIDVNVSKQKVFS